MSWLRRVAPPYVVAAAGVAAITLVIGVVRPWLDVPNFSVAYLLLVLWLGARHGWVPAVTAAGMAFLAYDWFLVLPYGTLWISAPRELVNLVVLVVAALVAGRMVSALAAREAGAVAEAHESSTLYDLAIAAVREPEGETALQLVCECAVASAGVEAMSLVAGDAEGVRLVAGAPLTDGELEEARRAVAERRNVGIRLRDRKLEVVRTYPAVPGCRFLVLSGGAAVFRLPERRLEADARHLLAALLGLAGLLLDRHQVAERARVLEASDRLKAAILSSVSHELKSPLASLRAGLTTLLMPQAGLDEEQLELLLGLDRQATRLDRLVGDLLTMSRLEAGLPPDRLPQDLEELVGSVLHSLHDTLAGFDVQLALAPDLPPVLADELQVERVLTNLLENAAEWTPPGGRITVGARPEDDPDGGVAWLSAWVENEGPAIAQPDMEKLFDKFWTRRRGGSGLGLAICRRIVEAHEGRIDAENGPDGPRFVFRLPAVPTAVGAG
jgi:two-component system, OmpR family, sensor histidine kinase KdpD